MSQLVGDGGAVVGGLSGPGEGGPKCVCLALPAVTRQDEMPLESLRL